MNNSILILRALPDSLLIELQAIANVTRQNAWRIGLITNQIADLLQDQPALFPGVGKMDVYEAVSAALEREYSARSVRDLAFVVGSYTEAEHHHYSDLPFSHFRFAASLGPTKKLDCLELSTHYLSEHGRPPSVDWLYTQFFGAQPEPIEPEPAPISEPDLINVKSKVNKEEALITGDEKDYLEDNGIPLEFEAAYRVFQETLTALSLPEWVRLRLSRLLAEVRALLIDNLQKT